MGLLHSVSEKGWNLYAPPSGFIQPIWRPELSYPGNAKSEHDSGAGTYVSTSSVNEIAGAIDSTSFFIVCFTGATGSIISSSYSSSYSGSSYSGSSSATATVGTGNGSGFFSITGSVFFSTTGATAPNVRTILSVRFIASDSSAACQSINIGNCVISNVAEGSNIAFITQPILLSTDFCFLHVSVMRKPLTSLCKRTSIILAGAFADISTVWVFFCPTVISDQSIISGSIFSSVATLEDLDISSFLSPLNISVNNISTTINAAANNSH